MLHTDTATAGSDVKEKNPPVNKETAPSDEKKPFGVKEEKKQDASSLLNKETKLLDEKKRSKEEIKEEKRKQYLAESKITDEKSRAYYVEKKLAVEESKEENEKWAAYYKEIDQDWETSIEPEKKPLFQRDAWMAHYSSKSKNPREKVRIIVADPKLTAYKWWGGDPNGDFLDEFFVTRLHAELAQKGLQIAEEGIEELHEMQRPTAKERVINPLVGTQFDKMGVFTTTMRETLVYIKPIEWEVGPYQLLRSNEDCSNFYWDKMLKLTNGKPTYIIYFDKKDNKDKMIYVTKNGQISDVVCKNKKEEAASLKALTAFFPKEPKTFSQASDEALAAIHIHTGHKPHKDCIPRVHLDHIAKYKSEVKRLNAEVAKLPAEQHTMANIKKLIREKFPTIINYYDVSGSSEEESVEVKKSNNDSNGDDHRTLSRFDPRTNEIFFTINSMLHTRMKPDHFKVPLTDENKPDYERLYFAFGGHILSRALKVLLVRDSEKALGIKFSSFDELVKATTKREDRAKVLQRFQEFLKEEYKDLSDEYRASLLKNYENLLDPNSTLLHETATYDSSLLGSFEYLTHFSELLDLYQKIVNKNGEIDLTPEQIAEFFEVVNGVEFQKINEFLSEPFPDAHANLVKLIDEASMAKDFKKIQKLVNILLGKQNLTDPFVPGKTVSPVTDGYDLIVDENNQPYTPARLTKIQVHDKLAHIIYKHLLRPTATLRGNLLERWSTDQGRSHSVLR